MAVLTPPATAPTPPRPTRRIRSAVIGGGASCEHDVSLASAAAAREALDPVRYDVVGLTITRDGAWVDATGAEIALAQAVARLATCDVVLPLVHGPHGEDGTLASLCELAGVPYVGCPPAAGAIAMDKWATKLVANAVGVRTARATLVTRGDAVTWTGPCVVKPVRAGSSHGVTLVDTPDGLAPAVELAFTLDDRVLVEEVVRGREIDIAIVDLPGGGRFTGPALEIVGDGIFDTVAKYGGGADFRIPAALAPSELAALESAALRVYQALGCRGLSRVDFFLTADGPVLNEVNTMPGLTGQSQLPRMMAAAGIPYGRLLDLLLTVAIEG